MKQNLEQFIHSNRAKFDDQLPAKDLWKDIEQNLDLPKNKGIIINLRVAKIAASILLILSTGIWIGTQFIKPNDEINYTISPEMMQFKDTEVYYQTQVSLKLQELNRQNDTETTKNIENDLKQLDEIYLQIKTEMLTNKYSNSSMMIEAMIRNHKTKVEILENILNKQKQSKDESQIMSL